MRLAKGASFRFTPITDQRYATLLTRRRLTQVRIDFGAVMVGKKQ